MPEQLPSTSWRYVTMATGRFASLRGYVSQRAGQQLSRRQPPSGSPTPRSRSPAPGNESQQSWSQWASQKIKRFQGDSTPATVIESVNVFPGWATRRPRPLDRRADQRSVGEFDVEIYVSGYASSRRPPEFASRSQRTFIRLAKGFASLPKLAADVTSQSGLSRSTEELLAQKKLPPPPSEIPDDYDVDLLDRQFWEGKQSIADNTDSPSASASSSVLDLRATDDTAAGEYPELQKFASPQSQRPGNNGALELMAADLRRLHMNLESRLQPFWSSSLASRTVRISLYASSMHRKQHAENHNAGSEFEPLAVEEVSTATDGSFQVKFDIKWEQMCVHAQGLHIAFGDPSYEHDLFAVAEILPPPSPNSSTSSLSVDLEGNPVNAKYQTVRSRDPNSPQISQQPRARSHLTPYSPYVSTPPSVAHPQTFIQIPLTYSPLRVISDVDDTIKRANVLAGARAAFRTVFVNDLHDITIPGMGDWYTGMWNKGVRFHYVSNGPFELLPVLNEFLQVSNLPPGSIRLKSYSGRSLIQGIMSDAASRKRAGVQHILDAFPDSRFLLIGDSGEQDLELYAELAAQYSSQVIAILIRDVEDNMDPILDPTGGQAFEDDLASNGNINSEPTDNTTNPKRRNTDSALLSSNSTPEIPVTPRPIAGSVDYIPTGALNAEPEGFPVDKRRPPVYSVKSSSLAAPTPTISKSATSDKLRLPPIATSIGRKTSTSSRSSSLNSPAMTQVEKRRYELQLRVWKARRAVPPEVGLRVFRSPQDCKPEMEVANLDLGWS
ncbi:hypothetical protein AX16_005906 [Volvariella volvacea WC 439]|nr:hypothetical protein AX16_005906 [Volvariella volvacea WC 439]